ncbi:MAG: FAD-binding protein [Anaerolineae bacterium]|nr:FAD-binding protein [Phycisphaerae bacterium]
MRMQNWAGNHEFTATRVHEPRSVDDVCEIVRRASKLRVLGTRHSFNDIADSPGGDLISTKHLDRVISIEDSTVTFEGGITYGKLAEHLHREGFALHNMASLPHISVAGAVATATHGSGDRNGNLATAVRAMEVVTADGQIKQVSRETMGDRFDGCVVSLGGLGVVTKITLAVSQSFDVRQDVFENLSHADLRESFVQIMSSAYSVSLFTDWRGETINQIWFKRRASDAMPASFASMKPTTRDLHPLAGCDPENCTQQMGVTGPWHERLPHFRMDFTPSAGEELQSEYFVPREQAMRAFDALQPMRSRIAELVQVTEIRTIASDNLWMSPCYQTACVAFHFTWKNNWEGVRALLPEIEATLAPFRARPHWGKLFTMSAKQIHASYPKLQEFRALLTQFDPHSKFRNSYLQRHVFGVES